MTSKVYLVAQREYLENIRTKAFWIGILLFPVLITAAMVVPTWLEKTKGVRQYAVVDQSGWLLEQVEQRAAMPDLEEVFRSALVKHRAGGAELAELPAELQRIAEQIEGGLKLAGAQPAAAEVDRLEEKIIAGFASVVAGFAGTDGSRIRELLPPEAVTELERLRASIQEWWLALPPGEAEKYGSGLAKSRYQRIEVAGSGPALIEELSRRVGAGDLFAYFVIGDDPVESGEGSRYLSSNLTDTNLQQWFERLASDVVRNRRLAQREIDPETARWVQEPLRFAPSRVSASGQEEEVAVQDRVRQWAPAAFVYLLWISVFTIAQMLLTNTVEEKSNRLMEVLLSSLSPLQLMVGKIVGIAATGLTMLGSWIVFFYLATKYLPRFLGGGDIGFDLSVIATDPIYIGSFVVYFLLGYLLYASFLVGIGSVCNSLKEAQNLMAPITLVLIVPLFAMIPITEDPNGTLAKVLSYVPPFTPFVMMNRAAGPPTTFEYLTTTLLLLVSVAAAMWAAAKVFRIGVLMTGKPPKLTEILRWIRSPVGVVPQRR